MEAIIDYVKTQLKAGYTKGQIENVLSNSGYQEINIKNIFEQVEENEATTKPPIAILGSTAKEEVSAGNTVQTPDEKSSNITSSPTNNQIQDIAKANQTTEAPVKATQPPNKKRKLFKVVALALGVALILGGLGTFYWYWQSPQRLLVVAADHMTRIKSLAYSLKLDISQSPNTSLIYPLDSFGLQPNHISLTSEGATDRSDAKNPASQMKVSAIGYDKDNKEVPIASLEARLIKSTAYGYLTIPLQPLLDEYKESKQLANQWYSLDIEKYTANVTSSSNVTQEQIDKEIQNFRTNLFLVPTEVADSEAIENKETRHFSVAVNREKLADFILQASKDLNEPTTLAKDEILKSLPTVDKFPRIDFWIYTQDQYPARLKVVYDYTAPDYSDRKSLLPTSTQMVLTLDLKNYNQPVTVTAPDNAKPLDLSKISMSNSEVQTGGDSRKWPEVFKDQNLELWVNNLNNLFPPQ